MRKKLGKFGIVQCVLLLSFSGLFVFHGTIRAAVPSELSADEIIKEADLLLRSARQQDAFPYLQEYLKRAEGSEDTRVQAMAQDVRFKLGALLIQQGRAVEALPVFKTYTAQRPVPQWRDAMKILAVTQLELGYLQECVSTATNALAGPPADIVEAEAAAKAAEAAAASEKNLSGYEFDQYGEVIRKGDAAAAAPVEIHPSGYSTEDLLALNMTLGRAYSELGLQEQSIAPFTYVIEHSADSVSKGFAIMQVVNGLIEKRDFERLTVWIPQLYRTDARYDIRVNLALLKAATALFDAKEYDSALPLFRMILPRGELIAYQSGKMREMQIKAGILPPDAEKVSYKTQVDNTILGKKYSVVKEEFWSDDEKLVKASKPKEMVELEELIKTLESLPPYENEVLYRNALLYDEVGRPWEAVRFFDRVVQADSGDLGERAFYDVIRLLLDPLGEIQEAEPRGYAYLDTHKADMTPRQIAYLLTGYYQQHDQMPKIKQLLPYLKAFTPSADAVILKYECELYYMQAVADMAMLNYELAEADFRKVLNDFPGSHQEDNATYWHGVSLMFLEKYNEALAEFEAYPGKFPKGAWLAQALFQSGTCFFGMEKFDEALERFTKVIEQYSGATVYPDACSLRGDIYGSRGMLDEAIMDYDRAIAGARTQAQAKYAVFQKAAVFEAERKYPEIITLVNSYLDRYGAEADISEGIYWIGKTRINQGRTDEAVQAYFDAIIRYGTDLKQGGVDSIIAELVKTSKIKLSDDGRSRLKTRLRNALQQTGNQTLQLRLRATLAQMDGTVIPFGKQLIAELADFTNAAPPVLAAICDASFEQQDYSRAEELLKAFLIRFSESEYMRSAYRLRGFDLYRSGKLDEALKLVGDVQARYGTDYDAAWAQLMKGDILLQQKRYAEARDAFLGVMNVRGWRGESYAEATYKLGRVDELAGDPRKAFGWYQRAYFQYKGYAKSYWAAEAYLASARCLEKMGRTNDARNTWRAMLFDKYVNGLPQAQEAIRALGAEEALEIRRMIESGATTNITVTLETEGGE
jgi:TolA-binding protein